MLEKTQLKKSEFSAEMKEMQKKYKGINTVYYTDIDGCNGSYLDINVNVYDNDINEYLDCFVYATIEYGVDDEYLEAYEIAQNIEKKLKEMLK